MGKRWRFAAGRLIILLEGWFVIHPKHAFIENYPTASFPPKMQSVETFWKHTVHRAISFSEVVFVCYLYTEKRNHEMIIIWQMCGGNTQTTINTR